MSSIHIDGSGSRGLGLTMNDPVRTSAQFATKPDDDVTITTGSGGGGRGELRVTLPRSARLVRLAKPDSDDYTLAVIVPGGSAQMRLTNPQDGSGGTAWPHVSVSAKKGIDDYYEKWLLVAETVVGEIEALGLGVTAYALGVRELPA